jgi:hypothetical protein
VKALLALLLASGVAAAAPTARDLDRALGGFERGPALEDVRRLGPRADEVLIAVASDARTSPLRRVRAIAALRFVPSAAARAFLIALVRDEGSRDRGLAVVEVAAALGALAPYEPELVLPYLAHPSADVRQSAAAALASGPSARTQLVQQALQARAAVERDRGVRALLDRHLADLAR